MHDVVKMRQLMATSNELLERIEKLEKKTVSGTNK